MNSELSPAVAEKLEDFRQRRQQLIISRGVCAGLISVVAAILVIAALDWLLFLPDPVLWLLSVSAYASVACVLWFTCLRLIWRIPNASQMAQLIETAEPSLREELVAAVELGNPDSDRPWQSTAFRRFLQDNVADKMVDVNVRSLLPWALIHRWVNFAVCAGILFLILLCIPGLQFGARATRALLPMADIGRVSLTQIEILAPDPPNTAVAQGDEIDVLVRIGGPSKSDSVTLETSMEGSEPVRVPMSVVDGAQRTYRSTVRMGRESIRYRVWANDARSEPHWLSSRQRPRAVNFEKTYRFPEYLQRPDRTETEETGDLSAVEGTQVDLVVEVSQPVSLAHVIVDSQSGTQTLPMTVVGGQGETPPQVRVTVPMTSVGSYRIRLVAADTGLENKFSPEFMIQAEPDKAPTIRIDQPPLAILVPSDEIVSIEAMAEDDWALDRIEQQVRIGEDPWITSTIAKPGEVPAKVEVKHPWDLYPLDLQPGSVVFTRLVAIDRKGSRAESQTIRTVISSHEFDPRRWMGLSQARAAHDKLAELVIAAGHLRDTTVAASDRPTSQAARTAADEYDQKSEEAFAAVTNALSEAQAGRESIDLLLVGQAISQASTVGVGFVRKHLAAGSYDEAGKASEFVLSKITGAAQAFDHLLRLSETSAVTSDLLTLRKMYSEAVERAEDGPAQRVGRRMQAIGTEAGVMVDHAAAMRTHADETEGPVLQQIESDLLQLEKLGDPFAGPVNQDVIQQAGPLLRTALANAMSLFSDGLLASVAPRKRLVKVAGNTDGPAFRAARYARELHELKASVGNQAEESKKKGDLSAAAFDAAVSSLMTLASLERERPDSDAGFVADSSRAWRATESIRARSSSGEPDEARAIDDMDQLAEAIRVLNIVRQTDDLIGLVTTLRARDSRPRQELADAENAVDAMFNPSDWFCCESLYDSLSRRLKEADLSPEALQILNDSRGSEDYKLVRGEMVARPQLNRKIETKSDQLSQLLADLKRVRSLLQDDLNRAREAFDKLSPRIDELLAELARDVQEDADAIEEVIEQAMNDPEQVEQEIEDQLNEADQLEDRVEEIREALREDAAEQDLLLDEGRERMRDDDDALAILDEQPEPINDALQEAAQANDPREQRDALASAAQRQAELADQLQQLAEHYENLREGDAEESRAQLREAEEALGVREQFDQQQRQLEQLAELTELPPEEALAALEEELQQNRLMQSELDDLTREQLQQTQAQLEAAANRQQQLADAIEEQGENLQQWSEQIEQLGREAAQLEQQEVAQAANAIQERADEQNTREAAPNAANPNAAAPNAANPDEDPEQAAPDETNDDDLGQENPNEAERNGADPDATAADRAAEAIRQAREQLSRAAQRSQDASEEARSRERLDQTADEVATAIQQAANQLSQASEQIRQANGQQGDSERSEDSASEAGNPEQAAARRAAAEAAEQAEELARRARELADDIDPSRESPGEDADSDPRRSDQQQQVADAVAEAEQSLARAARNQQRMGNQDNAEQLRGITEETEQASQLIDQNTEQADSSQAPVDENAIAEIQAQLEAVEQAIGEPAEQLEDFLAGESGPPSDEAAANDSDANQGQPAAGQPDVGEPGEGASSEPGAGEPNTNDSSEGEPQSGELGASEPGASEPGASEPSAGESNAGQPDSGENAARDPASGEQSSATPLSRSAARQLAEALNALDAQLFDEGSGQSQPGTGADDAATGAQEASQAGGDSPSTPHNAGVPSTDPSNAGDGQPASPSAASGDAPQQQSGDVDSSSSRPDDAGTPGENNPQGDSAQGDSAQGDSAQGDSAQGDSAQGDSAQGNSAQGNSAQGNSAQGNSAQGNSAQGNSAQGNSAQGNSAQGNSAQGNSAQGNSAQGNSAQGNSAQGNSAQGNSAQGNSAQGNSAQGNSAQGDSPGQGDSAADPVADAIAAAAQAQGRELAEARSGRGSDSPSAPGQGFTDISTGASLEDDGTANQIGNLPPIAEMTKADWARLPSKVARDLLDGRREKISPEYRQAVETYFRLIAEKSLEK